MVLPTLFAYFPQGSTRTPAGLQGLCREASPWPESSFLEFCANVCISHGFSVVAGGGNAILDVKNQSKKHLTNHPKAGHI